MISKPPSKMVTESLTTDAFFLSAVALPGVTVLFHLGAPCRPKGSNN
jgi:hypothetical protein